MPELPEVETVRRQLKDLLIGKTITDVTVRSWKSVKNDRYFQQSLVGQQITKLDRKGKYLFVGLSEPDSWLMAHLKMTGRLIFVPTEVNQQIGGGHSLRQTPQGQPHDHTRIIFAFADGSHLYFNDMRKFGWIRRVNTETINKQRDALGPEPLTAEYTADHLREVLSGRNTSLKAALLKQKDIAGLGNIYVDEACWRAQLRPDARAGTLSVDDIQRLYDATQSVLSDALSYGGTTFENFADTGGDHGNFTDRLAVFGQEGDPCPRCGADIEKIRCAGRGTHVCPNCQKRPTNS